jgi:release factor glutamine methyltransferase
MNDNVLKYEPHSALFVPDEDPLLFYREISKFAISHLNEHGRLFFEINENYAQETKQIIQSIGLKNIEIKKDFYNKNRMIKACIK